MPYKNKDDERAFRKRWWASLSQERKREKQDKANARQKDVRDFLAKYKINIGCVDCGYKGHHSALEFNHTGTDKEINVCNAKSIKQAKMEIEKCEVVCSNCHRIRTYNRIYPCKPDAFETTYDVIGQKEL